MIIHVQLRPLCFRVVLRGINVSFSQNVSKSPPPKVKATIFQICLIHITPSVNGLANSKILEIFRQIFSFFLITLGFVIISRLLIFVWTFKCSQTIKCLHSKTQCATTNLDVLDQVVLFSKTKRNLNLF